MLVTVVGGILVYFIVGLWEYKVDNSFLSGHWIAEFKTINTDYKPYKNMVVKWDLVLVQTENVLKGSGEKFYERSSKGVVEYTPDNRIYAEIEGVLSFSLFGKNKLTLKMQESGQKRTCNTITKLKIKSNNHLFGTFSTTAASSKGYVKITKK